MMEYIAVSSSNIETVGFDPDTQTLAIAFRSGTEYHYYNVPSNVFEELKSASSPGQYFATYVRRAGYNYARVR